jgi:hypothetical protein
VRDFADQITVMRSGGKRRLRFAAINFLCRGLQGLVRLRLQFPHRAF